MGKYKMTTERERSTWKKLKQEDIKKIEVFLTRQRWDVMQVLHEEKRVNHKDLARAVNSSSASLCNTVRHFNDFRPLLIESEVNGRYKYYSLTDEGEEYVEFRRNGGKSGSGEAAQKNRNELEEKRIELKTNMERFMNYSGEKWQLILENFLVNFLSGLSIFELSDLQNDLIQNVLSAVRRLFFLDDQTGYSEFYETYLADSVLADRFEEYMDLYRSVEMMKECLQCEGEKSWIAFQMLEVLFEKKSNDNEYLKLDLSEEDYQKLRKMLMWLACRERGKDKEAIYKDVMKTIDCDGAMSITLTDRIVEYNRLN